MAKFGSFMFSVVMSLAYSVAAAVCFARMWGWFAVPLGAKPINAWHAYGLSSLVMIPFITVFIRLGLKDADEQPGWFVSILALCVIGLTYWIGGFVRGHI